MSLKKNKTAVMKNINKALLIITLFISFTTYAQKEPFYKSYNWEENPSYKINVADSVALVTYKDKTVKEFYFISDNELVQFDLDHKIIWLNSDQEIENNNKIYLPYSASTILLVNKARVITKEGKVIELDDSKILTAEDEESKEQYKYFTFEGLEKGSFIEYISVYKKRPSYKGTRLSLQNTFDKYNVEFDLFSPTNLIFEIKSYNGLDTVRRDTSMKEKAHWQIKADTIQSLTNESQAAYSAQQQYLIYKLDRNITAGIYDISSYGQNAENAYSFLYNNTTKAETKALNKFIKLTEVKDATDDWKKIRAIEDYVKKNIFTLDGSGDELSDVTAILENNFADETGFIKLYARIFKILGIKMQLVMTCDRGFMKFDKEFEASIFLNNYLLYFPSIKAYMSPSNITSRVGFPSPEFTNNYGLFIKEVSLGDFNTGVGKVKFIKPVNYQKTYSDIIVDVIFDADDISITKLSIDHASGGYYAMYTQPIMHLLDEKTTKEVIDAQVKFLSKDIEITNKTVFNDNAEAFGIEPFRVKANAETAVFVEKAGDKYLFKVGELIGPQMEMYQEKKRVLPVENEFTRVYHRTITFTIPEGYQINNLDDLNIENKTTNDEGDVLFKFSSSYTVEGNIVTCTGIEYYTVLEIEPALYEAYRKVINSAADFNKVTLILEKK